METVKINEYPLLKSGKVREVYDLGEHLLFVATDRISAYDSILPTLIPDKGKILTGLSEFWFSFFGDKVKNHYVSGDVCKYYPKLAPYADYLNGRAMIVKKAQIFPVECVVRGYLAGSAFAEYKKSGTVCGKKISKRGFEYAWGLSRTTVDDKGVPKADVEAIYVDNPQTSDQPPPTYLSSINQTIYILIQEIHIEYLLLASL